MVLIDRDQIIQEVASSHGIILGPDDPVLAFLAVHDVVLSRYATEVGTRLAEELEQITESYQAQAKELAETIVGAAVRQIKEETVGFRDGLRELLESERQLRQAQVDRAEKGVKWAVVGAVVAGSCAALVAVAAIIMALT